MRTMQDLKLIEKAPKFPIEQIGDYLRIRLTAAEKLALAYELHHQVSNELGYLNDRCYQREEEEGIDPEKAYADGVVQIQRKAQKILENALNWRFDEQTDFLTELGIELP